MAEELTQQQKDNRLWGMLCHLSALAVLFNGLTVVVPIFNILGPLVIWLLKKNESPFIDEQGKRAVNFQISVSIAWLVCLPLIFLVVGVFLIYALCIADLVFIIIASIKANQGESYKYPYTLNLIK